MTLTWWPWPSSSWIALSPRVLTKMCPPRPTKTSSGVGSVANRRFDGSRTQSVPPSSATKVPIAVDGRSHRTHHPTCNLGRALSVGADPPDHTVWTVRHDHVVTGREKIVQGVLSRKHMAYAVNPDLSCQIWKRTPLGDVMIVR